MTFRRIVASLEAGQLVSRSRPAGSRAGGILVSGVLLSGIFLGGAALAADIPPRTAPMAPPPPVVAAEPFVHEIRAGVFAHDPWSPEKGGADLNAEILFAKPIRVADPFWNVFIPRPHIGASINFDGKTSNGYAGLTWQLDVTQRVFVEASFGGAINNGEAGVVVPVDRVAIGCNWSFRESASLGFRVTQNWTVMATVEHFSNAGLCNQNRGLTNAGLRVGYRF